MPITKSAKKALKVSKRRQGENILMKQEIKNKVKGLKIVLTAKKNDITSELAQAYSSIDKAAKKNYIHKNKASRLKSRLAKAGKKAELTMNSKLSDHKAKPVTKTPSKSKTTSKKTTK